MIAEVKTSIFNSRRQLDRSKFIIHRNEVQDFWDDMSLIDKQKLLSIGDHTVINYVTHHMNAYISSRTFRLNHQAYAILEDNEYSIYVYDCIMFRAIAEDKDMRELITAFLVLLKQKNGPINNKVHQVIANDTLGQSIVKVKASYIHRLTGFLSKSIKDYFQGQKIVLSPAQYGQFIVRWMTHKSISTVEIFIREVFLCILVILENQIISAFIQYKGANLIKKRTYEEPISVIKVPKNKACFTTMRETSIGKIDWPSTSIQIRKLKYRIVQKQQMLYCYKDAPEEFDSESDPQQRDYQDSDDYAIAKAFQKHQWYSRYHKTF